MKNKRLSKKLLKNRRGISAVFGNILLLLIIVVAGTFLFAYVANYVTNYQEGRGAGLKQRLLFEDIWFKGGEIDIAIYNYGETSCKITDVFIDGGRETITSHAQGVTLGVGAHVVITVSLNWDPDTTYLIKLLTLQGSTFEGDFASPI